jgi:RNA polymerase sigma-70 factor (ECF subfamily)
MIDNMAGADVETCALTLTTAERPVAHDEFARWVERARRLDAAAWDRLYQLAFPPLYRYVAAKVGSQQEAEDLTGEVFLGALQSASSLRATDEAAFLAWLFQIARHKLADRLRRQYRRPSEPLDPDLELPDPDPSPEEAALRRDEHRAVRAAVGELTAEQQEVILMKFVLDFDNARAAAVLGKTPGAINQLQHRALGQLRRVLTRAGA